MENFSIKDLDKMISEMELALKSNLTFEEKMKIYNEASILFENIKYDHYLLNKFYNRFDSIITPLYNLKMVEDLKDKVKKLNK